MTSVGTDRLLDFATTQDSGWDISVIGYCSLRPTEILNAYRAGTLNKAEGEFVVVLAGPDKVVLANSRFGTQGYYYAERDGSLFHGTTVLEVLSQSGLDPEWDYGALGDMLYFEQAIGSSTLHPYVRRLSPGETLVHERGVLTSSRFDWETEPEGEQLAARPEVALECFNRAIQCTVTSQPVLLMTAGFDSRVILSGLLRLGIRPILAVAGWEYSTDVLVARQIAKEFGLEVRVAELSANDLIDSGVEISAWTNGILPFNHASPYFYCQRWNLTRDDVGYMGMNGEYARTFYLDRGVLGRILNSIAPVDLSRYYWNKKHTIDEVARLKFRPDELKQMPQEFALAVGPESYSERVDRCVAICGDKLLNGLDRFYLGQRVAYFMGNLLRLCAINMRWRAPFLDNGWVHVVRRLPRSWKSGSNWHRFAVMTNCPKLLEYPEQGYAERWAKKAPPFYWRRKFKLPYISYLDPNEALAKGPLGEYVHDHAGEVDDLVPADLTRKILAEHRAGSYRGRALYYLLTLIFWKKAQRTILG